MRAARGLLGTAGIVMVLVGAYHLYDISTRGASRVVSIAVWTAGGVVLHDAVIAPLVVLVGVLLVPAAAVLEPRAGRPPGSSCCCSVTLLAIPVVGRFGARPDVPSAARPPLRPAVAGLRARRDVGGGGRVPAAAAYDDPAGGS